jgi:signal peptidase
VTFRGLAFRSLEICLVSVAVVLLVGQLVGQPVLLGYVETGSMAPTLNQGDGFVAVPTALAGAIEVGDVITFRTEQLRGDALATHRVVRRTDEGFITQGDANIFTDQESVVPEPPVQRSRIVAVAATVGGEVLVIPHLGVAVASLQAVTGALHALLVGVFDSSVAGSTTLSVGLVVAGIGLYIASLLRDHRRSGAVQPADTSLRAVVDGRSPMQVVILLAAALVVAATASMLVPGGVHEIGVVSAENDAPGNRVIKHGTSEVTTYGVVNGGLLPTVSYIESDGSALAVMPREIYTSPGERVEVTVTVHAPDSIGYYQYRLVEHRYLAVLPVPVIRSLYALHPWLPIVVIDLLFASMVLFVSTLVLSERLDRLVKNSVRSVVARLR